MSLSIQTKQCRIFIEVGVLFLVFFTPMAFGATDLWAVTVMRLVVGLITLAWLLQAYLERVGASSCAPYSQPFTPAPPPSGSGGRGKGLDIPLLLGFGFILLNTYSSIYRYATTWWLYQFLVYALLYQVLVHHLRTQRQAIGLVSILVIAGGLEAFLGLIRYLQGSNRLFGREVLQGRVTGTFLSQTHLVGYLEMIIPLALALIFVTRRLEKKLLLIALAAVMGAALLLSLSRRELVNFLLLLIFLSVCMAIRRIDRRRIWLLFALFLAILIYPLGVGISPVTHLLEEAWREGSSQASALLPLNFRQDHFELPGRTPLLGTGLGTFRYVSSRFTSLMGASQQALPTESSYLQLLVETGFLGLILFLWGVKRIFHRAIQGYLSTPQGSPKALTLATLAGFLAFLFQGSVDFNLHVPANALLVTLISAILMASLPPMTGQVAESRRQRTEGRLSVPYCLLPVGFGMLLTLIFIFLALKSYLAEAYFQQAQLHRKEGRWSWALEAYKTAIRLEGGNAIYHSHLGNAYLEAENGEAAGERGLENGKKALEAHARSVALNPFEPDYRVNLGWAYARLGNRAAAIAEFEKAISLYPTNPSYYRNLARYSFSYGDPDRGVSAYRQALRLDLSNLSAIFEECLLYGKQYTLCEGIIPNTPEARLQLARFLIQKHLWVEGEAEYEKVLQLTLGDPTYSQEFAEFCAQNGKYLKAIALWDRLLEKDPGNLPVRFQIAQAYQALRYWEKALEEYQKIVELKPEDVRAWRGIGNVWIQLGR